jgi:DNA-binding NarL/FixJ family response regulator
MQDFPHYIPRQQKKHTPHRFSRITTEKDESLQFLLERQGDLKVVGKSIRGKGVITKLKRAKPDVLVLDVRLQDSDGLLLLEKIRQNLPLPVVMLSMYEEYREYALRMGAFAYLVKGKDLEELYRTLRLAVMR